jgi:hypothetical protein
MTQKLNSNHKVIDVLRSRNLHCPISDNLMPRSADFMSLAV